MKHLCLRPAIGAFRLLLPALAIAAIGCSDASTPQPPPGPPVVPGSYFVPVEPPLSPDTAGIRSPRVAAAGPAAPGTASAAATSAGINYWFFLVNGTGLPTPPAPGTAAPPPTSPPLVLTVNGAAPAGAPNPNGGTTVGLAELTSGSASGAQLWRAVDASGGTAHLRSAASFNASQEFSPSLLLGYGASSASFDLGYLPSWSVSVYLNQSSSLVGDDAFLRWGYSTDTAQLTNDAANAQLAYGTPVAVVTSGEAPAPANQWYPYPNYMLVRAANQPDSVPPFPAAVVTSTPYGDTDVAGMQAAYDFVSQHVLDVDELPSCTIEGTEYAGIRCDYADLTATAVLETCASDTSSWSVSADELSASNPQSYGGTTISLADWAAVVTQLNLECQYAASVQATFNAYDQIFTDVFLSDSDELPSLAVDLGLSTNASVDVLPIAILDAIAYLVLDAADIVGVGADLMAMGITVATRSTGGSALQQALRTTVADLYSDLANAFSVLTESDANGQTAILSDWGRLRMVGPLAGVTGYNGLGIGPTQASAIERRLAESYQVAAMQTLMPLAYGLSQWPGLTGQAWQGVPSYDQYAFPTFGSSAGSYSVSFFESVSDPGNHPDGTVLQTDILDNGANAFELFNGINGWSALPGGSVALDCTTIVTTLFNATPNDLRVVVDPAQGYVAAPGVNFCPICTDPEGSTVPYAAELPPYGYVTIFSAADGNDLTTGVSVFDVDVSTSSAVATFNVGSDGCRGDSLTNAWDVATAGGCALSPPPSGTQYPSGSANVVAQAKSASSPGGLWLTIYRP